MMRGFAMLVLLALAACGSPAPSPVTPAGCQTPLGDPRNQTNQFGCIGNDGQVQGPAGTRL